jgi:hypothetical protein
VNGLHNIWLIQIVVVMQASNLFLLMRFGIVTIVLASFVANSLIAFPITLEASAWYSGVWYTALAIIAAIVIYAFRTSFGGCPLLGTPQLDD